MYVHLAVQKSHLLVATWGRLKDKLTLYLYLARKWYGNGRVAQVVAVVRCAAGEGSSREKIMGQLKPPCVGSPFADRPRKIYALRENCSPSKSRTDEQTGGMVG